MNQSDFARQFGLNRTMLNGILRGRLLPGDEFAADLALALSESEAERAEWQRLLEDDRKAEEADQEAARQRLKEKALPLEVVDDDTLELTDADVAAAVGVLPRSGLPKAKIEVIRRLLTSSGDLEAEAA